jgi:UDP-N-acetylmuramate: L-alanyl-gamma-D-glutamyl-meso-diaminopimelate ligase
MFNLSQLLRNDGGGARHIHFSGICGTAMAGVAAELHRLGARVTGSDQAAYPPTAPYLESLGIPVAGGYAEGNLEPVPDLVVIGNALSRGNPEVETVLERGLSYCSLPELLRWGFLPGKRPLVVTGTHGKTTTAALCAWLLREAGTAPSWLVGGIPLGLERGFHLDGGDPFVLEGDEYDTAFFDKRSKFLHYRPRVLVLNNLEFDHADIFDDLEAIRRSFRHLLRTVPRSGVVLANRDDPEVLCLAGSAPCRVLTYSVRDPSAEWYGEMAPGRIAVRGPGGMEFVAEHTLVGSHQGWNLLAAMAAAAEYGLDADQLVNGVRTFPGVRRRAELRGEVGGVQVFDDFAHHPTAIRGTLTGFRERFPGRRIWALLEPRSNTMRRARFQEALAEGFTAVDEVCIREVPDPEKAPAGDRLDVHALASAIAAQGPDAHAFPDAAAIVSYVAGRAKAGDVVVVLSNGGFEGIHETLLAALGEG